MNETYEKNKFVAGLLALFLGSWGAHRFYLGRFDGIFYLMFSFTFIPFLLSILDAVVLFLMPEEEFQAKYGRNSRVIYRSRQERKILDRETQEIMDNIPEMKKKLEQYKAQYANRTVTPNQNRDKNRDYISNEEYLKNQKLINKDKFEPHSANHEHIKGDPALTASIRKAQQEMATAKATQYYIDSPKQVNVQDKLKELKELKKSGFISKEEYNEEVRKLMGM